MNSEEINTIREKAVTLDSTADIADAILAFFGGAKFVLIGEASHGPQLTRAIGLIYRPETARLSHYFVSVLAEQFAVEPLDHAPGWTTEDAPETYSEGI